jgi:hypothetical protein
VVILKGQHCPSQASPVSSSDEKEEHGRGEDRWHVNEDKANQQYSDSRSPMLDTIDKMTTPTKYSLLDGIGNNVELALANTFLFQKICHTVLV